MNTLPMFRRFAFATAVALAAASPTSAAPQEPPEAQDTEGFKQVLARSGRVYIAGQPTEDGLARMQQLGVKTVVNLRTDREVNDREIVPFDEAAAVEALGMRYVRIPLGGDETPYRPEAVDAFDQALKDTDGPVLLHCTVAWRASHLWAAWLVTHQGYTLQDAVDEARRVNFSMTPFERLLGKRVQVHYTEKLLEETPSEP